MFIGTPSLGCRPVRCSESCSKSKPFKSQATLTWSVLCMAGRKRKGPWRRSIDNCWYTTVDRKSVKVAPATASYDEAFQAYCDLHAVREPVVAGPQLTVSQLFDQFLEWCQQNRSANTYRWYGNYIKSFHQHHGAALRVRDLRPYHVDAWLTLQRRFGFPQVWRNLIRSTCAELDGEAGLHCSQPACSHGKAHAAGTGNGDRQRSVQ